MPLSINTNIASIAAQRSFLNSSSALETAYERLATGKRINSSVDDAAGLAIGVDLTSRVSGLNQAVRNVNDGISMLQITEGAYDEVTTILQRMRDIAVQASNGSMTTVEHGYLSTEHTKLISSLNDALGAAAFANKTLVSTSGVVVTLQSGADSGDTTLITLSATATASAGAGLGLTLGATGMTIGAASMISEVDNALDAVAGHRATLGAQQAQLESTVRNLSNVAENTAAAAGRIMDTDYAAETANLTKAQILQQAATSVLAQANAQPQAVLALLQ